MEKPVFTVGDRTDKFCTRCGEERGHIVSSVTKRGQISRVSCSKCDTVSTFHGVYVCPALPQCAGINRQVAVNERVIR
jgi:hypothetical protein